jgi:tRNA(Ile)-lysidine synthase
MELVAAVAETIKKHSLIPEGCSVLVALSGGPDSTALLSCLATLGVRIHAAHLNHQFRGAESDGDAAYAAELCASLSIPLTTESIDVPALRETQRGGAQQIARSVRYAFLERVRKERGLDRIATAHNRDDRLETVLMNIVRGTGVDGLRGIPYRRGPIIRPLLDTPRSAVEEYIQQNGLSPRTDSSNKSLKYLRNSVRAELLPLLERKYNPGAFQSILRLSEIAADESDFVNGLAKVWVGSQKSLAVPEILREPAAFQRRILREWIRQNSDDELSDVSHILVEQLRQRLGEPSAVTLPGGTLTIESSGSVLTVRRLAPSEAVVIADVSMSAHDSAVFGDYVVSIITIGGDVDRETLHVRQWQDGDRIVLKGGTKKVQDLFTDCKIPRDERRQYPVIADNAGIIAVGDLRCAMRAAGTKLSVIRAD